MPAVIKYMDEADPTLAQIARRNYGKLMMWAEDPEEYGFEASRMLGGFRGHEKEVLEMLRGLLERRKGDGVEFHSAQQNARLVVGEWSFPGIAKNVLTVGRRGEVLQVGVLRPRSFVEFERHIHVPHSGADFETSV